MRNYASSIVLILAFVPLFSQTGSLDAYCNQKFDFCIHYPGSLFEKQTDLDQGEGIILSSEDGDIELEILGVSNVNNWTTKDIYYFHFEDILTMHPSNRLLHSKIEPEFFIVESIINHQRKYYEVRMREGYYISINLKVPEYFSEMDYQHLLSRIGPANAAIEEY